MTRTTNAKIAGYAGFISNPIFMVIWIPMAVFELVVAEWFIVKGVADPVRRQPA